MLLKTKSQQEAPYCLKTQKRKCKMHSSTSRYLQHKADKIYINLPVEISPKDEYDVLLKRYDRLQEQRKKSTNKKTSGEIGKEIHRTELRIRTIKHEDKSVEKLRPKTDPHIIIAVAKDILSKYQWVEVLAEAKMRQALSDNGQSRRIEPGKKNWLSQSHERLSNQEKKEQNIKIDSFLNGFVNT